MTENSKEVSVTGLNSGYKLTLDLETLLKLFEWYFIESPKEVRDVKFFLKIARLHDNILEMCKAEKDFNYKYIKSKLDGELRDGVLDGSEDMGRMD
jgi:hypothetical protein